MELFYNQEIDTNKKEFEFNKHESIHISKVLRKKKGDIVQVTNGSGLSIKVKLIEFNNKYVKGQIITIKKHSLNTNLPHIAISPIKSISRFEWFLEKATEIGVKRITPIICKNTIKKKINLIRFKKIIQSALKQSNQFHIPKIDPPIKYDDFINCKSNGFITHCSIGSRTSIKKIDVGKNPLFLIGPEGDFSLSEIELAKKQNFTPISLGDQRFRTETAAIYVCFQCLK